MTVNERMSLPSSSSRAEGSQGVMRRATASGWTKSLPVRCFITVDWRIPDRPHMMAARTNARVNEEALALRASSSGYEQIESDGRSRSRPRRRESVLSLAASKMLSSVPPSAFTGRG